MADLQTVTAAVTVAQLAWDTCIFFKNVKNADATAKKLYQKTRQLCRVLQDVEAALRQRKDQRDQRSPQPNEARIESNISAAIEASRQVLLRIDRKLKVLNGKEELSFPNKSLAQVQLTLKQAAIARHESDLDLQIQALQTSLGALQLFGQEATQSQLRGNHAEILAKLTELDRAIKRANTRLLGLSTETPGKSKTVLLGKTVKSGLEDSDDAEGLDGVQTLKDCINTAETIRVAFESTYDPDGRSTMQLSEDLDFEHEVDDREELDESDLDDTTSDDIRDIEHGSFTPTGSICHPNLDHDEPRPLEVLSLLIEDFKEHALKDLDAGNPKRAEVNVVEAIKHGEERENKHAVPFKERIELLETLAIVYRKQKKWAEARKILHGMLQEDTDLEPELVHQKELQRAKQYHLLATIHLDMHQACATDGNPHEAADLRAAEKFANLAFTKIYKLRGVTVDRQNPSLLDTVQSLIKIHEAQGRTALADSYYRRFIANCTLANPLPDELLRSLTGATGSDFDVVDTDDLLISAIKARDQNHIQGLLDTADVNCRCTKGKTPLMHAVEQGDEVTIRKLLDRGAEINAITESGATALHQAAVKGNVRMANLLLELDADLEAKDKNLATPIVKAVEKSHGLLVSYLLGQSADVHIKDKAGWTLLHHAAHNGAVDVLKHLLYPAHEVDVNATCPAGKTALHYCAELTLVEPARVLLDHKANVDALDANSRSPLFFAVQKPLNEKREQFVNLLLRNGAQVDPERLPARQRDYPALQNHPALMDSLVPSSSRRRESAGTEATSKTNQSNRSFLRRFSLISRQE